ncbi:hypothetical protein NUW54_g6724 [Trametes sanguinea]|uniref:Uncharacterized protein n=1 Tax=Trametes sanguinea TaxID=158606 RepID=A0ACC1PT43_9APHY|nr:hypothetical protein NUW54_g6724 [Trametes sanguinea]
MFPDERITALYLLRAAPATRAPFISERERGELDGYDVAFEVQTRCDGPPRHRRADGQSPRRNMTTPTDKSGVHARCVKGSVALANLVCRPTNPSPPPTASPIRHVRQALTLSALAILAAASSTAASTATSSAAAASGTAAAVSVIAKGFENDGQDQPTAGQVPSLTSSNQLHQLLRDRAEPAITNGKQIKTGSCNPAPMGMPALFPNGTFGPSEWS